MIEHQLHKCKEERCFPCNGGLALCEVCRGAEASLPTECPGTKMTQDEENAVQAGVADFVKGLWFITQGGMKKIMTLESNREERITRLAVPTNFTVHISVDPECSGKLTEGEAKRLNYKLLLVERCATRLAANMLKGTIKYPEEQDGRTVQQWWAHFLDDHADSINYLLLLEDKLEEGDVLGTS